MFKLIKYPPYKKKSHTSLKQFKPQDKYFMIQSNLMIFWTRIKLKCHLIYLHKLKLY